jgi:hypothetical protein
MKKVLLIFTIVFLISCAWLKPLWSGELEILLQKLVDKKILTVEEANNILDETKAQVKKEMKEGKHPTLPKFVQNMEMKGDIRLRYQGERETGKDSRHRGRVRLRFGVEGQVADKIKAGFRLVSGGADPRSTNQTFQNFFESPDIRFDMAFVEYSPIKDALTLVGGKFENPLWRPSDMLWDSDITLDGAAVSYGSKTCPFFMSTGFAILDEDSADTSDPFMLFVQPGVKFDFEKKADLKFAVAGYYFNSLEGSKPDNSANTNTRDADGALVFDYNSVAVSAEFGVNEIFAYIPRLTIFGEYIHNPDPDSDNNGWMGGLKFGSKKVQGWSDWNAKYQYKHLEKDAWLDTFPDSDTFGGKTGIKGHEGILTFGLAKNTSFDIDYYYIEEIDTDKDQHLIQTDINVKF